MAILYCLCARSFCIRFRIISTWLEGKLEETDESSTYRRDGDGRKQLTSDLLRKGVEVRVLTREAPEKPSTNVEFFVGDMLDPYSMRSALSGIDKLFLLNPVTAEELTQSLVTLGMAERANVKYVTYLSVLAAEKFSDVPHFAAKLAVENELRRSRIPHTILRPGFYFQNDLGLKDAILGGLYPLPVGSRGIAAVDIRCIAEAAAITLTTSGSEGLTFDVTAVEPMTGAGNASIWSRQLGRDIRYGGHDLDKFEERMRMYTAPWEAYDMRIMFERFHDRGFQAPVHEVDRSAALLKRPPRSYETFVSETLTQWNADTR
jgi:uncharacterized protein YbjT (DUF2867 family)